MSKTATLVRVLHGKGTGVQKLYRLSEPLGGYSWYGEGEAPSYSTVVVSAITVPVSGPETYIFGADESGDIIDWGELHGSYRGGLDHIEALERAGYEVTA